MEIGVISLDSKNYDLASTDEKIRQIYSDVQKSVSEIQSWAKSIIVLVFPYKPFKEGPPLGYGKFSAHYKYYPIGRTFAEKVVDEIKSKGYRASLETRIPAKPACLLTGLGSYGKNSLIYSEEHGSFITIYTILTDALFDKYNDFSKEISFCDDCGICLEKCPTNAILEDGLINQDKCLREHMFTNTKVPPEMLSLMGDWIIGCEICQVCCPKNKKAMLNAEEQSEFEKKIFDLDAILSQEEEFEILLLEIKDIFGINYSKKEYILKSAIIAAGNLKEPKMIPHLTKLLNHSSHLIRDTAQWSLDEINS